MEPRLNETAEEARARGVDVPPEVPDRAVWATQRFNSVTFETPRWIWFTHKPYEISLEQLKRIAGVERWPSLKD